MQGTELFRAFLFKYYIKIKFYDIIYIMKESYFENLIKDFDNYVFTQTQQQIFEYAQSCREKFIPCIREKTAKLLCHIITKTLPKNILEIGTATGCSGALMLLSCLSSNLTTLDVSEEMCKMAQQTFDKYGLTNRAQILCDDALNYFQNANSTFDFIFLDGPKGQYIKYLPYLKTVINGGGIIFCDDVLYFGMVLDDSKVIHKKITIVRNLREFLNLTQSDTEFETKLLDIEDGVLLIKKQ